MTYQQYWQKNEDLANIKIKPKINKSDIQYQTGTLRTKMFAFLSSLQGLNLKGDILAYDENDILLNNLGVALEDTIDKTNELDEDEEKRMIRQYEMLKQGHVFLEEIWDDSDIIEKKPIENYGGQFRGIKIKRKQAENNGRATRNIVAGLQVYLGDLTKYLISEQPYIFTAQTERYDDAKRKYGSFEMWQYVSKKLKPWSGDSDKAMSNNSWRFMDTQDEWVEIIKYQDKPNDEYQIIINGVPMLPIGFPFPWGYKEYNITQQNLKPIRHNFAYGKSFIFENKNPVQLLDEMMKLALLKTQKSFTPPYLNISGRVISSQVLMPGKISMGITPGTLIPISDKETQGVTSSEFAMIQELIKETDRNTISQTFTGQRESGQVTATQIVELQRQARLMMGVLIMTASLLEKKLTELRLMNILRNWFNPIDEKIDEARNVLKNKYRIVSRQRSIEGEGTGLRFVVPTEEMPTSEEIRTTEEKMGNEIGMPVRIIVLNPKELAQAKMTWLVSVNPREKRSSELGKLMFKGMVMDAAELGLRMNPSYVEERFAQVWEEDPGKMFVKEEMAPGAIGGAPGEMIPPVATPAGQGNPAPTIKAPKIAVNPIKRNQPVGTM
jgi:hypothetical protein